MKKCVKIVIVMLIALVSLVCVRTTASADTGPKPYVSVTIEGNTEGMYMTLLSKTDRSGPFDTERPYGGKDDEINKKFKSYADKDGFYYLNTNSSIANKTYKWSYHPPQTFKMLIYDSINDTFLTDNVIYECYAFASTYKMVIKNNNVSVKVGQTVSVTKVFSYTAAILNFLIRLVICLAIEILIGLAFGFKRMEILILFGTNVITQLLLNLILNMYIYFNGYQVFIIIPFYILAEIIVPLFECCIYSIFIPKIDNRFGYKPKSNGLIIGYTILANTVSLGLGFVILTFIPGMII